MTYIDPPANEQVHLQRDNNLPFMNANTKEMAVKSIVPFQLP